MAEFVHGQRAELERASEMVVETLRGGGTVLTCGNGGSAAHAVHLEAELVGRYRAERDPLPAVYLGMSAASSTAIANDYESAEVFARPLRTLGNPGDLLLAFSTSGTSPNVLAALEAARDREVGSILLSGLGARAEAADVVLRFPGPSADAIQDGHDLILHAFMDAVDAAFAAEGQVSPRRL